MNAWQPDFISKLFSGITEILNDEKQNSFAFFMELINSVYKITSNSLVDVDTLRDRLDTTIHLYLNKLSTDFKPLNGIELLEFYEKAWKKYEANIKNLNCIFAHYYQRINQLKYDFDLGDYYEIERIMKCQWDSVILMRLKDQFIDAICDLVFAKNGVTEATDILIVNILKHYNAMRPMEPRPNREFRSHIPRNDGGSSDMRQPNPAFDLFRQCFTDKMFERCIESYDNYHSLDSTSFDSFFGQFVKDQERCEWGSHYFDVIGKTNDFTNYKGYVNLAFMKQKPEYLMSLFENGEAALLKQYYTNCNGCTAAYDYLRSFFVKWMEPDWEGLQNVVLKNFVDTKNFIDAVTLVWTKYVEIVDTVFCGNNSFKKCMEITVAKAFNSGVSTGTAKHQDCLFELLARYSDNLLSKTPKSNPKADIEADISKLFAIVNCLHDKDLFLCAYHKLFARRVIQKTSFSENAEAFVIETLTKMFGNDQTRKLRMLYANCQNSKELTTEFKDFAAHNNFCFGMDLSVTVINQSVWPSNYTQSTLVIPRLCQALEIFNAFYLNKHASRKLHYLENSFGEIVCNQFEQKYSFMAKLHQTGILIMFNNADVYTIEKLQSTLNISRDSLVAHLTPILKANILKADCDNMTSETTADTEIRFNMEFRSNVHKTNLMKGIRKAVTTDGKDVVKKVEDDRKMAVQAAIIRIMKKDKRLSHTSLVAEVIRTLSNRFQPDIKLIKNNIGALLEKEYIARDPNDHEVYVYIA